MVDPQDAVALDGGLVDYSLHKRRKQLRGGRWLHAISLLLIENPGPGAAPTLNGWDIIAARGCAGNGDRATSYELRALGIRSGLRACHSTHRMTCALARPGRSALSA